MKKTITKICILITTILLTMAAALLHSIPALAHHGNFTIYPSYMHGNNSSWIILDAEQGTTVKDYLTLENLESKAQTIQIEVSEAYESEEDPSAFIISDQTKTGFTSWIKTPESSYTLEPFQKIRIPMEINIPKDAELNNYTGAVLASHTSEAAGSLNIETRIGVRMYLNVVPPSAAQANIFSPVNFAQNFYFFLSFFAILATVFYTVINYLDYKKYEKKHA